MTDTSITPAPTQNIEDQDSARHLRGGAEAQSYLSRLTRQPLLTAAREVQLTERIKAAKDQLAETDKLSADEVKKLEKRIQVAKDEMVEANMRLVINVARTYHSSLIPFEDLV